ncbi:MAG: hypothetical protein V2J20_00670 [Wenzhouxiangella sp.]|jgi:hypothetical protein|nr:hypothetical protein [Wenzhouxiangella sp.]
MTHQKSAQPRADVKTRKPWHQRFETVGSISAIVVGVAALFVSWDQSRVMREDLKASLWPALQVEGYVSNDGQALGIGVRVQNAGVGPARIERFTMRYLGETVPDINGLIERLPPGSDQTGVQLVKGRIVAPGDSMNPFEFSYSGLTGLDAVEMMGALADQWSIEICYCSVLDQCWVSGSDGVPPQEVADCAGPGTSLNVMQSIPGSSN